MFRVLKFFFFWFWDRRRKSSSEERCKSSPLFNTHTQHIYIMFAATQQIASVAGLKATKVQVRRHNARRLFCFLTSSSSFFGFVARARDLDPDLPLARWCAVIFAYLFNPISGIPKRVVPRGKAIAETIWISKEEEREEKARLGNPRRSVHQTRRAVDIIDRKRDDGKIRLWDPNKKKAFVGYE